jgi:predicted nucleic acid-binding protein
MDWKQLMVLKASIIELQELIHELAKSLEKTRSDEDYLRLTETLEILWVTNQERAFKYRGNSDSAASSI